MSRKPKPSHWENLVTILGHFGVTVRISDLLRSKRRFR